LQVLYKRPNIVTTIKVMRLEWAGYLVRMTNDRTVNKLFLGKKNGRRRAARPQSRWLHYTENDLKSMSVK
jgi:hypothetical protein